MDNQTEKLIFKALKDKRTEEVLNLLKQLRNLNFKFKPNSFRRNTPLLCAAVTEGNKDVVEELLKMGADTDAYGDSGMKPLHLAIKHGRIDIMKLLLSHGDSVHSKTDAGDSALFMAVINRQAEIVEHLISRGAKLNEEASFLYSRNMPIHEAAKLDDVKILNLILATKPNVNLTNDERRSALHVAASLGCTKNVERLIQCGANVNLRDTINKTALQLACENNHVQVVRLLCIAGSVLVGQNNQNDPLEVAVSKRYINVVRTLLHHGADANRVFEHGLTALHLSIKGCRHGMRDTWKGPKVSVNSEIEMLDTLMQAGADVNHISGDGMSPVHRCVLYGCEAVLDYLLTSGADYNKWFFDGHDRTALQLACSHNTTPAIRLLIRYCPGLVSNYQHTEIGESPMILLWHKRNLDCLKLLLDAGYKPTNKEKNHVEMMERSDKKKVDYVISRYLTQEFTNPWKLSRISRTLIRNHLAIDLTKKVQYLPIPELLRRSLLLTH